MPKDYHLLPQHSQDLLRGARSGRIYKRPPPVEEDEVDAEGITGDKPEKKEDETKDRGFSAKAWKQIPRHLEGPDIEYLAKRRKTVITIGSKAPRPIPTVTKAKLKRVDAAGNAYIQDVIVPHGQEIVGEVISQTEIPDPTAVAGLAQSTPIKKKPVVRKKTKGPGRGRKKKLIAPTSVPIPTTEAKPAVTPGSDVCYRMFCNSKLICNRESKSKAVIAYPLPAKTQKCGMDQQLFLMRKAVMRVKKAMMMKARSIMHRHQSHLGVILDHYHLFPTLRL